MCEGLMRQGLIVSAFRRISFRLQRSQWTNGTDREKKLSWSFLWICLSSAARQGRMLKMVRTAVENYGFVGIRSHSHDGRITREACEAARASPYPSLRCDRRSVGIEFVAQEYPDVNFMIPHLRSFADDWKANLLHRSSGTSPNIHT